MREPLLFFFIGIEITVSIVPKNHVGTYDIPPAAFGILLFLFAVIVKEAERNLFVLADGSVKAACFVQNAFIHIADTICHNRLPVQHGARVRVGKLLYPLGQIARFCLRDELRRLNTVDNQLEFALRKQARFQPVALCASVIENFKPRRGRVQLMDVPIDRADVRTELMVLILRADVLTFGGVSLAGVFQKIAVKKKEACV